MKMQQTDSFSNSQDRRADWLLQPLPLLVYLFGASVGAWLGIDSMFVIGGVAGKLLLIVFLFAIPVVTAFAVARPPNIFLPIARPVCFSKFRPLDCRFVSFEPAPLIRPPAF